MSKTYTKNQAEAVVQEFLSGIQTAEDALKKILDHALWIPLGYSGIVELWKDRFEGHSILIDTLRVAVVVKAFQQGASEAEITSTFKGIGPAAVRTIKAKLDKGVAPRTTRTQQRRAHTGKYDRYRKAAEVLGLNWDAEVDKVTRALGEQLVARSRTRVAA